MNFATLKGLTIPEGVVTRITDASGRVLWAITTTGLPVVLEVTKITSKTYVGSTSYTGEQFILLDIYPKAADSIVDVTYGGLTKRLEFSGTNAQQVFFGTFGGAPDSVETPETGTLTIEGDFSAFGCGAYKLDSTAKDNNSYCACITAIRDCGAVTSIPVGAFKNCNSISSCTIPSSVTSVGDSAFEGNFLNRTLTFKSIPTFGSNVFKNNYSSYGNNSCFCYIYFEVADFDWDKWAEASPPYYLDEQISSDSSASRVTYVYINGVRHAEVADVKLESCSRISNYAFYDFDALTSIDIPASAASIGAYAFYSCSNLSSVTLREGLTIIGDCAFEYCTALKSVTIPASVTAIGASAFYGSSNMSVELLATTPPTLGDSSIFSKTGLTITVPAGCGEAYKAAEGWIDYADYIVEAS